MYCCGSPLYLKNRYGVGYHLTLLKSPSFDAEATHDLIKRHTPTAELKSNIAAEASYILHEDSRHLFKGLFEEFETQHQKYGISSFGISVTTMEEVFLKVGEVAKYENKANEDDLTYQNNHADTLPSDNHSKPKPVIESEAPAPREQGLRLRMLQFYAIFVKCLLNSWRKKTAVLVQFTISFVLLCVGVTIVWYIPQLMNPDDVDVEYPPRELVLSMLKTKGNVIASQYGGSIENLVKKSAQTYFGHVAVEANDISNKLNDIEVGNKGDRVSVLYSNGKPYKGNISTDGREACCHYKHIALNQKCYPNRECDLKEFCNRPRGSCVPFSTQGACEDWDGHDWDQPKLVFPDIGMDEYILENHDTEDYQIYDRNVAGFTVNEKGAYTTWYSGQAYHTIPSAFSAVSNIILKASTNNQKALIVATNHPLPQKKTTKNNDSYDTGTTDKDEYKDDPRDPIQQETSGMIINIFVTISFCFTAATFLPFLITERVSQAKHVQFVSGVSSVAYWGGTLAWNFIHYMIFGSAALILFAGFDFTPLRGELGSVFLLIVLFGISVLPFVCLFSYVFQRPAAGYAFVATFVMMVSLAFSITTSMLQVLGKKREAKTAHHFFLLLPTYAFPKALSDIWTRPKNTNVFAIEKPGSVGTHCLYMFFTAIVYSLMLIALEEKVLARIFSGSKRSMPKGGGLEDEDVRRERLKVEAMPPSSETALLVKDLTKMYSSNGMVAVDHLNLEISKGEWSVWFSGFSGPSIVVIPVVIQSV